MQRATKAVLREIMPQLRTFVTDTAGILAGVALVYVFAVLILSL